MGALAGAGTGHKATLQTEVSMAEVSRVTLPRAVRTWQGSPILLADHCSPPAACLCETPQPQPSLD